MKWTWYDGEGKQDFVGFILLTLVTAIVDEESPCHLVSSYVSFHILFLCVSFHFPLP